jgi:hypothetical protein
VDVAQNGDWHCEPFCSSERVWKSINKKEDYEKKDHKNDESLIAHDSYVEILNQTKERTSKKGICNEKVNEEITLVDDAKKFSQKSLQKKKWKLLLPNKF